MTTISILIGLCLVAFLVGIILFRSIPVARAYFTYRGKRLITCPETSKTAAVDVSARTAAAWTIVGEPKLRLDRCSRWPERQNCGQECLEQVETDPDNCLLWNIVSDWYEGKRCVYCHKVFGRLHHLDHAPALMGPDRLTTEWNRYRPEQLPELFARSKPVCWNCHVTETFRWAHPELVVERDKDVHHVA